MLMEKRSSEKKLEPFLFTLLILIELIITFFLINGRRMGGHDTFYYFSLQYYFLNSAVTSGEIPQWIPYLTHGTTASWWYNIQGVIGLLTPLLLMIAKTLRSMNFLDIFHVSIFYEKIFLLTGIWLLAKRFYSSIFTVFFVACSVLGSCLWISQLHFNFHFYYCLPLILYFFHRFFETKKWLFLFLATNLLCFQTLGNVAYFLPAVTLIIFLYFTTFFIFLKDKKSFLVDLFPRNAGDYCFILLTIGTLLYFIPFMKLSMDPQIFNLSDGRSNAGDISLTDFLHYGGTIKPLMWLELLIGISPGLDYNLYIGLLPLFFIFLVPIRRTSLHFIVLTILIILLGSASIFATICYHIWPLMTYYRHLGFFSIFIKIFLCFIAGFGFERFLQEIFNRTDQRPNKNFLIITSLIFFCFTAFLSYLLTHKEFTFDLIINKMPQPFSIHIINPPMIPVMLRIGLTLSLCFWGLLLSFHYLRKYQLFILTMILFAHCLNIYQYNIVMTQIKSFSLQPKQYKILSFEPIPFVKSRDPKISERETNFNLPFLKKINDSLILTRIPTPNEGIYWTENAFLFEDRLGTRKRIQAIQSPLIQYLKAYEGQNIDDLNIRPHALAKNILSLPADIPSLLKISGVTDKIQFFSKVFFTDNDQEAASLMSNPKYPGNILFLSKTNTFTKDNVDFPSWTTKESLSLNTRLDLPYHVTDFDSNNLTITVSVPIENRSAWMFYSDIWHPQWQATVNGKPAEVFKANLAYKAVLLEAGENKIHFYFKSKWISFFYFLTEINALFWLIAISYLLIVIVRKESGNRLE